MSEPAPHWRPACEDDLDAILAIQDVVHELLPESRACLADKLALCPDGARVLAMGTETVGYGLSHPWRLDEIVPLDAVLAALPRDCNCLYLHDVALLPAARQQGAGRTYVAAMTALARRLRLPALALISVYGTVPIWGRCGFVVRDVPSLVPKLATYGESARYMMALIGDETETADSPLD